MSQSEAIAWVFYGWAASFTQEASGGCAPYEIHKGRVVKLISELCS